MRLRLLRALALLLSVASCSAPGAHDAASTPLAAGTASQPAAVGDAGTQRLTVVSVLGDSHSGWPESWYRLSVGSRTVPGATPGVLSSHPGRTSIELQAWVDEATGPGGAVLVQAGTNDLLLGHASPAKAAQGVEALVNAVSSRGAAKKERAILVSVPPSATLGAATNQLNAQLRAWAAANAVPWLDVTSRVTLPDGTWPVGLSDDGIHANDSGGKLMAEAVQAQLPDLLAKM